MNNITEIDAHYILMDTRTESGHWIYVIECPESQKPELIVRESARSDEYCPCGRQI